MKRQHVRLDLVDIYTAGELRGTKGYHFPDKDGNLVRVNPRDGKTLEEHLEGIEYIKTLIKAGTKVLPPLLLRKPTGRFKKLDGFKRLSAMQECNVILVEAFVAEPEDMGKQFWYDGNKLTCKTGGQPYQKFSRAVEYGEDETSQKGGGRVQYLYKSKNLRIEFRENIHVHWGPRGRNRFALGRRDFELLEEALNGKSS